MKILFRYSAWLLFSFSSSVAIASDFSNFDNVIRLMAVATLLGIESGIVILLFTLKKFKSKKLTISTNIITSLIFGVGLLSLLSFVSQSRWSGSDLIALTAMLLGSGFFAMVLPNYQRIKLNSL